MRIIFFLLFLFSLFHSFAQTANISGIINTYIPVTGILNNYCSTEITVTYAGNFSPGDRVLIIQMQGAKIDSSNSVVYGDIQNYGNAGNYEFGTISQISGNSITLEKKLIRDYSINGAVQLVSVPHFTNAIISGTLSCQPWNGLTGGILAFEVEDSLLLNSDIDVSGKGFRGGQVSLNSTGPYLWCGADFFYSLASKNGGKKGEGISFYCMNKEAGRGKNSNGGGGGNDHNSGGAGGANYGAGGAGGAWIGVASNPVCYIGGTGGENLIYSNDSNRIFLGGGGGGAHQNNYNGTDGKNGGGIVIIKTTKLLGQSHIIKSDGLSQLVVAGNDGAGGGGAGGAVLIDADEISNVTIQTKGGKGGDNNYFQSSAVCVAPGGGGGGGVIWTNGTCTNVMYNFSGEQPGIITNTQSPCYLQSFGATAGQNGVVLTGLNIPESNISGNISIDLGNDSVIFYLNTLALDAGPGFAEYYWNTGDTTQTLLVHDSIFGLGMHLFFAKVTDSNGCYGTDSIYVTITKNPVYIEKTEGFSNVIYPVPFDRYLHLNINSAEAESVDFLDITGAVIYHTKYSECLDLPLLKQGFYLLRINNKDKTTLYYKVLKN